MGTPLGPKYKPYSYMDPLGISLHCASGRGAQETIKDRDVRGQYGLFAREPQGPLIVVSPSE